MAKRDGTVVPKWKWTEERSRTATSWSRISLRKAIVAGAFALWARSSSTRSLFASKREKYKLDGEIARREQQLLEVVRDGLVERDRGVELLVLRALEEHMKQCHSPTEDTALGRMFKVFAFLGGVA